MHLILCRQITNAFLKVKRGWKGLPSRNRLPSRNLTIFSVCKKLICPFVSKHECLSLLCFVRSKYTTTDDGIKQCYFICQPDLHDYGWFCVNWRNRESKYGLLWQDTILICSLKLSLSIHLLLPWLPLSSLFPTALAGTSAWKRLFTICSVLWPSSPQRTYREVVRTVPASGCETFKAIFNVSIYCLIFMVFLQKNITVTAFIENRFISIS